MEPTNKESELSAVEQSSTFETLAPHQMKPLTTQEASTVRDQKSGGPRTQQGKDKSKLNALKHGLFSKAVLLKGDPTAEFDYLLTELRNDLQPEGMLEVVLVDKLAAVLWRYRRLLIAEGLQFESVTDILNLVEPVMIQMDLLVRYGPSLDRELDRILRQLERRQRMRFGQPLPPSIDVNITSEG